MIQRVGHGPIARVVEVGNSLEMDTFATVIRRDSVLQNECRSAWRLANDGSWIELHGARDVEERWEQAANSLAASCFGLEPGARMVAEEGNVILVATRDAEGVVIGLRDSRGNPITMISALHRIETRVRSREGLEPLPPRREPTVPLGQADSEPQHHATVRVTAEYLNTITEMAARHIDRHTVSDFWIRSLRDAEPVADILGYDFDLGFTTAVSNRGLTPVEIDALDTMFAAWKLRIRMALGTIYEKIPVLKRPPWK